jgi:RNA polymerase sigma-70 factor (ECF subfamily)
MNPQLEQIWNELADRLRRFIRARVADPAESEDVLQDVFLKISRRASELPPAHRLENWVFSIARNTIIDRHRTRRDTVELPDSLSVVPEVGGEELEG